MAGAATTEPTAGSAGMAGQAAEPPADVAGRWALFVFEDPVGVQLTQAGDDLAGEGCAGGTPPLGALCGQLVGKVTGRATRFWFSFEIYTYAATTRVSDDGQRMTGSLHAVGDYDMPTAWLRVPDGEAGLTLDPSGGSDALNGAYVLTLTEAEDGGSEYALGEAYRFNYVSAMGIASDLGAFWHTEIIAAEASAFQVGPVPVTTPELAVSMLLETDGASVSRVLATTGSGHHYQFSASRDEQR